MADKIVSFLRTLLIVSLIVLILLTVIGVLAIYSVPRRAMIMFGPPGDNLGQFQRVLYSLRLLTSEETLTTPLDSEGEVRPFTIGLGEPVQDISRRLEEDRLIASASAFRTYLIYSGLDTKVQAGRYRLSPAMTPVQIAQELMDPVPEEVEFNILPGWRAEEIAAALPTSGLAISAEVFMQLVNQPPAEVLPQGFPPVTSLEGFLIPGTYQVSRDISAQHLVALFLRRFDEQVTPDLRRAFENRELSLREAVTLASIVQREAVVAEEQPMIASVFYNRLGDGMKLDSDPTVQYAVAGIFEAGTWWKNPLTQTDLQFDSRYNTYIYPGLPPGPICSPGLDALRAVAFPDQTPYYYFRAQCDGSGRHFFAETYEEHLQNACP